MDDLDVHEKAMILEGLIRVRYNGRQMAAHVELSADTRAGYTKDADLADALEKRLRKYWWGAHVVDEEVVS